MSDIPRKLRALARRWAGAASRERANAHTYLIELCDALEVDHPGPAGSGYEFEFRVDLIDKSGDESKGFIDLWKRDHFVLEAKDEAASKSRDLLLRRAYGQARNYVASLPGDPPPFIMVLDVGRQILIWDRWSGSFGGFNAGRAIDLTSLADYPDEIELLQDIWENPTARDPRQRAISVTREIAIQLAELATSLGERGNDPNAVSAFLMRCVFTMFAEDIGLLPQNTFLQAIEKEGFSAPDQFSEGLRALWAAMDRGGQFGFFKLRQFNGHFFKSPTTIPLTSNDLVILHQAAKVDWKDVEPAIFGTLLVRALDPVERHRLGAEYTPRQFIERLIQPTVEEPIRARWNLVEAEVIQLVDAGQPKDRKQALKRLLEFHGWLRSLRFLDPACGSGNFLYVALHAVKRIELEVIRAIASVSDKQTSLRLTEVDPSQFYGIEIKPWARDIAELTLWIGFHQFWRLHHDVQPPEPILRDTRTLENRDAVLAFDKREDDPARSRPDPTPKIRHPVTGLLVPDPAARLRYLIHTNPHPADWPEADFIFGNPPYMGRGRQREAFGDGYVDALRATYPEVPDNADYVMYWWYRAAEAVRSGKTRRAGLITTNTIVQQHNRAVVEAAQESGALVKWAIPDHPWVDESGAANVRVAMTVIGAESERAVLLEYNDAGQLWSEARVNRLNSDLTAHADVTQAAADPLIANKGLSSQGVTLVGSGFLLTYEEARRFLQVDSRHAELIKPFVNGKDLASKRRGMWVIDFGLRDEAEAQAYPVLLDVIRARVKPERDANNRMSYAKLWWRFGEPRRELREALRGLKRFIATVETSRYRFFTFLDAETLADHAVVCIALDDPFALGVLSSAIHVTWAAAVGGRLGVGNDSRYQKKFCFDSFPFPVPGKQDRAGVGRIAAEIDDLRKRVISQSDDVTMSGMYGVLDRLKTGEALSNKEQRIYELGACGRLAELHEQLDVAVAKAYGWAWPLSRDEILARLVSLHRTRKNEESSGKCRWLRLEYQAPRYRGEVAHVPLPLDLEDAGVASDSPRQRTEWPTEAVQQLAVIKQLLSTPMTIDDLVIAFDRAPWSIVERHVETLVIMGEVRKDRRGRYRLSAAAKALI
jgi:hypothetical protein